jgi:hypothetical protein
MARIDYARPPGDACLELAALSPRDASSFFLNNAGPLVHVV